MNGSNNQHHMRLKLLYFWRYFVSAGRTMSTGRLGDPDDMDGLAAILLLLVLSPISMLRLTVVVAIRGAVELLATLGAG